mmetsp:Transcript_14/g.16  ORF Transcript_14/g.16 Transcript_14/m.16 type:complete len:582 (-) Transcript_14:50-1795(-)|eukprot:CAMPEP_0184867958 /NCGR_PEP_ID=MMETSP0580-20130426/28523_1 /TAXON_ID=1118495 /ORGANISM="Dactyliosolen fragilissimus" /LENGTH=581 /DNA_ID=CAMNT_0027368529 /DNA_START=35 /DNA_END=1780 /DNA_ORIENTATION=+
MIFDAAWKDALLIVGIIVVGIIILFQLLKIHARNRYHRWLSTPSTPLDVDSFVNTDINPPNHTKIWFLQRLSVGNRQPTEEIISLSSFPSPHVEGLRVTQRASPRIGSNVSLVENGAAEMKFPDASQKKEGMAIPPSPLVIGTIRMGFGHHRIAYAACSWALSVDEDNPQKGIPAKTEKTGLNRTTYFHDLLNIDSEEADLIKATDETYSKMSRLTSNLGGYVEKMWGKAMLSGNADVLRISGLTAVHLRPLFRNLPLDTPIIATHCYVALAAVASGFTNVINLVIDNHAQWFVVVPGCLNLVQGPANYMNFLKMGVKPENLKFVGHWIPRDLHTHIEIDCQRRIQRAKAVVSTNDTSRKSPIRILVPVGGAGAQRKFIVKLVEALGPLVKEKKVHLFLNAGDHAHMKTALANTIENMGIFNANGDNTTTTASYEIVSTLDGVRNFRESLLSNPEAEPSSSITLFAFDEYFPAVATTDILVRVSDIMACKPSELAFYPIPKLMIRRVGDHEQYSAIRAAELGDGTFEVREVMECVQYIKTMIEGPEMLTFFNECIVKNYHIGIYDGCKEAVKIALEKAGEL